jgi:hypothetical protein
MKKCHNSGIFGGIMSSVITIGKLKRPLPRLIFAVGMLVSFIGFFLPVVNVQDEGVMNLFTAGVYFNEPGTAFISTFLYAVWIASFAGVVVFFTSHFIVSDFVTWLIGFGFGIAAIITLWQELEVNPFGYMFIGSYVVFVGMAAALVGLILEAVNIKR